jgi:HlyD family secretion protein
VKRGQVLAELTAVAELRAAVRQAEARVQLAESHVAQVEAPTTESSVRAGQAQIERLEVELRGAQAELRRKEGLVGKDLLPRVQLDGARLQVEQIGKLMAEARQRVAAMNERRPADVAVARAELAGARADLERARVELDLGTIRAPEAGRVVRVFASAGEAVGPGGLLEIAPDGPMVVIADVYESDVARVKVGQKAKISGAIFEKPIEGKVAWISPQIVPRTAPTLDPTMYSEGRVFQARIDVSDGKQLADRIHARVNVTIER